ncbi:hypothetical protein CEXT_440621 [Caerostris extrusa]|uniref:Uncharacterized protein n=1 Tax=Caerostris extrusa TaxID=172846 RepID=A0AAV4RHA3_CAEEX|nr:hypothetical protein CEXT_440621 [Caerostris extrusa]
MAKDLRGHRHHSFWLHRLFHNPPPRQPQTIFCVVPHASLIPHHDFFCPRTTLFGMCVLGPHRLLLTKELPSLPQDFHTTSLPPRRVTKSSNLYFVWHNGKSQTSRTHRESVGPFLFPL